MKYTKYISVVIYIVLLVGLIIVMVKGWNYVDNLERQVAERDMLIEELAFSESLIAEYFDIEQDSVKNVKTYTLKQSKRQQNVQVINRKSQEFVKEVEDILSSQLIEYNSLRSEYTRLVTAYNDLIGKYNENYSYSEALKAALSLIYGAYEIGYDIKMDSIKYKISLLPSPKIDSALILLPYFRENLEYDKEAGVWLITTKTPKRIKK